MKQFYIKSKINFIPYENGVRNQLPEGDGYSPTLLIEESQERLPVEVNGMPVSKTNDYDFIVVLRLIYYTVHDYSVLKPDVKFKILEGNKEVGSGEVISDIYEA
jgi:hypothetical protein